MPDLTDLLWTALRAGVEVVSRDRLVPWSIERARLSDGSSVIVKFLRTDPRGVRADPAQVLTELCALQFLEEIGCELAPRVLAHDLESNVVVLEDLGPRPSLFDLLRDGAPNADAAEAAFARALAELHAATAGREDAYYEKRRALGPVDPRIERRRYMGSGWPETQEFTKSLGVDLSGATAAEIKEVIGLIADPGPFLSFSNGDACAFNFLVEGVDGKLIDFEFAGYRHALTDIACLYVPGSMWITVDDPVARGLETEYRHVVSRAIPEASDDREYGRGLSAACIAFAVERLHRFPYVDARNPEHLSRLQLVSTLESAARASDAHSSFPELSEWMRRVALVLRSRWRDADVDLDAFRPYTPRIDE